MSSMFVQNIDLLPQVHELPVMQFFAELANGKRAYRFVPGLQALFRAMDGLEPDFLFQPVPYFNGELFKDSAPGATDGAEVLDLTQVPGAVAILNKVSHADWREVNPTIFGTLFEGALDERKRAQLGAHYTSEEDIRLIAEPVLMQPLYDQWAVIRAEAEPLMHKYFTELPPKEKHATEKALLNLYNRMTHLLESTRVLDPACGSGNFLYVSLRMLKDLESMVRHFFQPLEIPFRDVVTPRQLYGIEKDVFAAKLAQVVVWIGYLQWRYEMEGVLHPVFSHQKAHPYALPNPILQDKYTPDEPDHILCADSLIRYDSEGKPYEPEWAAVDVIIGNPPFMGSKRVRAEIGDQYIDHVFALYSGRVPHEADLVTYWFEKARAHIEQGKAKRAGLLATNSIRGGANRTVLDRIKQTGDIFLAWSDRPWLLDGAAVRISMVGFDNGSQKSYLLDGAPVLHINADLQNTIDATQARQLPENANLAFMGVTPGAPFDIPGDEARKMIETYDNLGKYNIEVVRPYYNAMDLVRRPRDMWTIDFGTSMSEAEASLYKAPFEYVKTHVLPLRLQSRQTEREKTQWWLYARPRPEMRAAIHMLDRYLATPMVSKHRVFCWLSKRIVPANLINVIARDDDYFFGVLHSRLHELWSLRLGTSLEDRPRYTPTSTFETYPFPFIPGKEDVQSAVYQRVSEAAKQLDQEREAWLNPADLMRLGAKAASKTLKDRTLTNLYNALEAYHQKKATGNQEAHSNGDPAVAFAPRLAELHDVLDGTVLAAYGWHDLIGRLRTEEGDEEVLRRLLALNLERSTTSFITPIARAETPADPPGFRAAASGDPSDNV